MKLSTSLVALGFLAAVAVPVASAGPAFDWDPAYFWEPGATFDNSIPNSEMKIVGIISAFGPPFDFLNANDPTKDYTFYCEGLISQGTLTQGPPSTEFYTTNYTGGTITIYEGTPRDAVFTANPPNVDVPSTFTDGTVLLTGTFTSFYTQSNNFTAFQTGNAEGTINWTGGSLIDLTETGGQPCPGLFTGGTTWRTDVLIPGYLFRHDGKIDLNCPIPVEHTTWGGVKSLYR